MRLEPKEEGMRWLMQARQDLDDARYSFAGKRYHLACFLSQQAAEKAIKALLYSKGKEMVLGHSVARLIKDAQEYDPGLGKLRRAGGLDKFYIPTRYPNGLPGGVPYEAFDEDDAKKAIIGLASEVIEHIGKTVEDKER